MKHVHLDSDALLRAAYGIEDDAAWRDCSVCSGTVTKMQERQAAPSAPGVEDMLPESFWTRQRQAVLTIVNSPRRPRWVAIGVLAAVSAVAIALMVRPPASNQIRQPGISAQDERLFERASEAVTRIEPQALEPINPGWTQIPQETQP